MSIGFNLSDLVTVIEIAAKIRKGLDAPTEFTNIAAELESFSSVLQRIDLTLSEISISEEQKLALQEQVGSCRELLIDLDNRVSAYRKPRSRPEDTARLLKRVWKSLKNGPDDIARFRQRIITNLGLLNAIYSQTLSQKISNIAERISHVAELQERNGQLIILDWLVPADHDALQLSSASIQQRGTGQWFLSSPEVVAWFDNKTHVLFCPGMPGAGKTIMTSLVIKHLTALFEHRRDVGMAFIYFDCQHPVQQNAADALASILRQFAQPGTRFPDSLKTLYAEHTRHRTRPSFEEISSTVQSVVATYSGAFILIDALDESPLSDGERARLLKELFELGSSARANVFITSRFIPDIMESFHGNSTLEIRAADEDIGAYIDDNMHRFRPVVRRDAELQKLIKSEVPRSAQGMFLLARLRMDYLVNMDLCTAKNVRTALLSLPTTSAGAYGDTMRRIENQGVGRATHAKRALAWLTCARRPLKILELQTALSVEVGEPVIDRDNVPDIADVISACAGLVTIEAGDTVRLAHNTAREYFTQTQGNWFPEAQNDITSCCVAYLSFPVFNNGFCLVDEERPDPQLHPFFDYAAEYWVRHAQLAPTDIGAVSAFLSGSSRVPGDCLLWAAQREEENDFGWLLQQGVDANLHDQHRKTPLHHAVLNGWLASVQLLLRHGAELTLDIDNMTPFHYTVSKTSEDMAQIFLDAGVPIDTIVARQMWKQTYRAGKLKYTLDDERNTSSATSDPLKGYTALHYAVLTGCRRMTKFFLNQGANPNARTTYDETALHLALKRAAHGPKWPQHIDRWNDSIYRIEGALDFIGHEPEDEIEYSATLDMIEEDRLAIVNLLLNDSRTSVSCKDAYNESPLHCIKFEYSSSPQTIIRIIRKGANANVRNGQGQTPLQLACLSGGVESVAALLEHGADVMSHDFVGMNALHYAARSGSVEILCCLQARTTDEQFARLMCSVDSHRRNALHHLLGSRDLINCEAIQFLLDHGADVMGLNDEGMPPLLTYLNQYLLGSNAAQVADLLLRNGTNPSFTTAKEGLNLAHLASKSGWIITELFVVLADCGVDLHLRDSMRRTVLHHCAIAGSLNEDLLKYLVYVEGLQHHYRDAREKTALEYAAELSNNNLDLEVFDPQRWARTERLLLELGAAL